MRVVFWDFLVDKEEFFPALFVLCFDSSAGQAVQTYAPGCFSVRP